MANIPDKNQLCEQACFRSVYLIDHLQIYKLTTQNLKKQNKLLCLTLADYEKTLESVEQTAVLTNYENKILTKIIRVENICNNNIAIIQLHKGTGKMNIEKRVRH